MNIKKKIIIFIVVATILIIADAFYIFWIYKSANDREALSVKDFTAKEVANLYPGLDWKEALLSEYKVSNVLRFCKKAECYANDYQLIGLSPTDKIKEHIAYKKDNILQPEVFHKYYDDRFKKLGFTNQGEINLPKYGGALAFGDFDHVFGGKTTAEYGKVVNGKLYMITTQSYSFYDDTFLKLPRNCALGLWELDTYKKLCDESFGKEYITQAFVVHLIDGIELSKIFKNN